MSLADETRRAIDGGLAAYAGAGGVGPDAYCAEAGYHPMADGKVLRVLAALRRSKLLSATQFEDRVTVVCCRLQSTASSPFAGVWCWGLGFPWRDLPANEPFLITSALIIRGALDCLAEGLISEPLAMLLERGVAGIRHWLQSLAVPVGDGELLLPAYSPGIRIPVFNAAAYAFATLQSGESSGWSCGCEAALLSAMEWLRSRRVAGVGWPYSPDSPVVDLLHQCYILNAMADVFGTPSIDGATAEMVGQFAGPCCFADVIHLRTAGEAWADGREVPWLRPLGSHLIEVLPKPARLWSLGEMLVLISRLGLESERAEAWLRLGRRIAESILRQLSSEANPEARYPRHLMHALHGLAGYLELLRARARQARAPSPAAIEGGE